MEDLTLEALSEGLGLVLTLYTIYSSMNFHRIEMNKSQQLHQESIQTSKSHHEKEIIEAKRIYLLELFTNLEQHFQQLNADLMASSKESERDMFDQRNQSLQTIILASSVMFGSLTTAIVNGILPADSSSNIVIAYSVTCSLSFAFLMLSMVICMEIVVRASKYMYAKANDHTLELKKAILQAKSFMNYIRENTMHHDHTNHHHDHRHNSQESSPAATPSPGTETPPTTEKAFHDMSSEQLEIVWSIHEKKIQEFFQQREKIHERIANSNTSFDEFWQSSCKSWSEFAIGLFYCGTMSLLVAIIVFMYAQFTITYSNDTAAYIALALLVFACVLAVAMVLYFRFNDFSLLRDEAGSNRSSISGNGNSPRKGSEGSEEEAKV